MLRAVGRPATSPVLSTKIIGDTANRDESCKITGGRWLQRLIQNRFALFLTFNTENNFMRWLLHLSLSGLLAVLLVAASGCNDPGNTSATNSDASNHSHDHEHGDHDHDGHDHDGGDHGDHAHSDEHQHPETYDEAVSDLLAVHEAIADAFAADKADDAHGPLHDVGHMLEVTETLVEQSDMDADIKEKLHEAIEQLFTAYGAIDDKMHDAEEGKDYSEVSEQIASSISTLKAQTKTSKE